MTTPSKPGKPFSIGWFVTGIAIQVLIAVFLVKTFRPDTWEDQIRTSFLAKLGVFMSMMLCLCFFEWFFHRYVLHRIVIPFLGHMARTHRLHHAVCYVREMFDRDRHGRYILNRYPIESEEQYAHASFPIYALAGFGLLFTPLLWLVQHLLPSLPIYLSGYAAIVCGMSNYEIMHALQHYPYRYWKQLTEDKIFGGWWRLVYGHHEMHHFMPQYNENIAGFFCFPLADIVLRTYCRTINLLLQDHERIATVDDFIEPESPRSWVRWLDATASEIESAITHRRLTAWLKHAAGRLMSAINPWGRKKSAG